MCQRVSATLLDGASHFPIITAPPPLVGFSTQRKIAALVVRFTQPVNCTAGGPARPFGPSAQRQNEAEAKLEPIIFRDGRAAKRSGATATTVTTAAPTTTTCKNSNREACFITEHTAQDGEGTNDLNCQKWSPSRRPSCAGPSN